MTTKLISGAALLVLVTATATIVETKEPAWDGSSGLRLVRHGQMSTARAAHQATRLGSGQVLITGGCHDAGCDNELASVELYDPETRAFRSAAPMATPRRDHVAVLLLDGRVLVAGGWMAGGPTASAELYDPITDRWAPAGEMVEARMGAAAVPLASGDVVIMGGRSRAGAALASMEIFRAGTASFTPAGTMNAARLRPEAVALKDGRVLVSGGQGSRGEILRSAEIYDPKKVEFSAAGEMTAPRVAHANVLLGDGRVLIVGGGGAHEDRQRSTEIYDPSTGGFALGPMMHWPRRKIRDAVVVLPSGAVLVAGGSARAEVWNPLESAFVPVPGELEGGHEFATATTLPSGEVLVLGGYSGRIRPSASAWLVSSVR